MKLVGNYLYLALAETASKAITLAAFAYMARVVGREDGMPAVEFASAATLCAALAVDMGFGSYGAREIARQPQCTVKLASQIVFVRLLMGLGAFALLLLTAFVADSAVVNTPLVAVFGLSLLCLPFLLQWVFQGHDWMGAVAGLNLLRQFVFVVLVFAALRGPQDVLVVAWAETAGAFGAALVGVWLYRRWFGQRLQLEWRVPRAVLVQSATIGVSQILWSVKMFGATVLIGLLASADQRVDVADFGAAMRILVAMHTFIWLYYFNLLPAMSRSWHQGSAPFAALVGGSMRVMGWAALISGWLWIVLSPTVMSLVYSEDYRGAAPVLQWMAGIAVLAALSGHFRMGLIACGFQKDELITAALGALAAIVLIPVGFYSRGAVGAAAMLVIAEAVVWLASWLRATARMGALHHAITLFRPVLGVAVAALLAWMLAPSHPMIQAVCALAFATIIATVFDGNLHTLVRRTFSLPVSKLDAVARS